MKWYSLVLSILVIAGLTLLSVGKRRTAMNTQQTVLNPAELQPQSPRSQMQGIQLVEQAGQSTAWQIFAEHAEFSDDAKVAIARGVRAQLFQDDTALLSLEANRGIVQRDTGDITMQARVRIIHENGFTMTTQTLNWRAETRHLHTDEVVELEGPSVHITGTGLQSDVDQQRFHLEQHVHASFRLR